MTSTAALEDVYKIIYTEHHDPFTVLGIHPIDLDGRPAMAVRAFLPGTKDATVVRVTGEEKSETPMVRVHADGFFEAVFPKDRAAFAYKLKSVTPDGAVHFFHDSYAFLPQLTEFDLYLFGEGNHYKIYEKLGAHFRTINGIGGAEFAVWAPNARSVSVIGSFNNWDRRMHAMRSLGSSGVWEIFIPGVGDGELYKFEIKTMTGHILEKSDPFGFAMEVRPRTASILRLVEQHVWQDEEWIRGRSTTDWMQKPISIYELHLGSWQKSQADGNPRVTYRDVAPRLIDHIKRCGFTHVELLPIMEHPFDGSWGYQVTGYYAPTSRYGDPDDLRYLIEFLHQEGIGVFLDWVPAHFPKDAHALGYFDGTHVFEHADPRQGEHADWGTFVFNYGRNEVRNFLTANALYWIEQFHIDGLRIDAVASMLYLDYSRKEGEWVPNRFGGRENLEAIEFIRQLNFAVHTNFPGVIMMAEESTAFPGVTHPIDANGLGFDLKWNMGWMHDMLEYFSKDPIFRKFHHNNITFGLLYAFNERFLLPISHDEVVHGKQSLLSKMPGDYWQKFANLRAFLGFMIGHPGKKLLFMGQEFGQWNEWNHDAQLDWTLLDFDAHAGIVAWMHDLNAAYRKHPALHEIDFSWEGFQWIDLDDRERSLLSFERIAKDDAERITFLCNFTPMTYHEYRLGVSEPGTYEELLNSDSHFYGGSGVGNCGAVEADEIPCHGRPCSLRLNVPPLAVMLLRKRPVQ